MKNLLIIIVLFVSFVSGPGICQDVQEESLVINVEVPVRVFDKGDFIDNLTLNEFELYENGILQKLEAVYLIKKRTIERREEEKRFSPKTNRNFYLLFEVMVYNEKLREAIDYFVQSTMAPGDNLTIVTPMKTYRLRGQALEFKSREEIANQFVGLLRKDILEGNSDYRNTINDMRSLSSSLSRAFSANEDGSETQERADAFTRSDEYRDRSIGEQLMMYETLLYKLENLRRIDQQQLLDFSNYLKEKEGQKSVYLFYQNEYIPRIETRILNQYMSRFQDRPNISQTVANLFEFFRRDINIDVSRVKQSYADASITIHFLFLTIIPEKLPGITMVEQSEDMFSAFREMANATGGYVESSANPEVLFQNAVEASNNYYLLYYSPKNYTIDGKFREISVKIKGKSYRIFHRAGYFSD